MDTFGIGAAFDAGMATVSFGFESASSNDADCSVSAAVHTITTAAALITAVYGDPVCGDMDTIAIGAEMPVSDLTLSAGSQQLIQTKLTELQWALVLKHQLVTTQLVQVMQSKH